MAKNIIIGVGNLLFKDDGVGIFAVSYLKKNFSFKPELELLDGGTLGFGLMDYFVDYDNVIVIDTISVDDEAGSLYQLPSDELLGGRPYKNTAHEVEVVQMLQSCELYDKKADVVIFGVVPKDIKSVGIGLSDELSDKFDILIEAIIKKIQELGIKVTKKASVGLEEIIKEFK